MKVLVQALSLTSLILFTSCAHYRGCGDKAQCEMHKKQCCEGQCPMKSEEKKEEPKK